MKHILPFTGNTYTTDQNRETFLGAIFPTCCFYTKLLKFVFLQSRAAAAGRYTSENWALGSLETLKAFEESGIRFHIEGLNYIRQTQTPCVFIGNHMSSLETLVLPCLIQPLKEVTFIVKKELSTYPFFGKILLSQNPIALARVNAREDLTLALSEGSKYLHAGRSLIVFPQSTRSTTFDPALFNSIGIKIAKKAQVPVIPLAIRSDACSVGTFIKDFGAIIPDRPVHISFGEALTIQNNGKEEHAAICRFIQNKLNQWA